MKVGRSVGRRTRRSGVVITETKVALTTSIIATWATHNSGTSTSRFTAATLRRRDASCFDTIARLGMIIGSLGGRMTRRIGAACTGTRVVQRRSTIATSIHRSIGTSTSSSIAAPPTHKAVISFPSIATPASRVGRSDGRLRKRIGVASTKTGRAPSQRFYRRSKRPRIATLVTLGHGTSQRCFTVATQPKNLVKCCPSTAMPDSTVGSSAGRLTRRNGVVTTGIRAALTTSTSAGMNIQRIGISTSRCIAVLTPKGAAHFCRSIATPATTVGNLTGRMARSPGVALTGTWVASSTSTTALLARPRSGTSTRISIAAR
mmetsp:Transcript_72612/g.183845  ORF Transcript_72612/g.183845 Transcript_72612/m.183845 type:complete len:318 (+) Transcript_72612:1055-2008(+)